MVGRLFQKREDMSTHTAKTVIKGTPLEAGVGVWEKLVLPCVKALKNEPPLRAQQFYAGALGAFTGALVAEFGHEMAVSILRTLADSLDSMRDELGGSRTQ